MRDDTAISGLTPLVLADVPYAAALSASFGWPHRQEDWSLMLRIGEGLKLQADGRLQGTIMWWSLGPEIASIGMVMVRHDLQGQGSGTQLMHAAVPDGMSRGMSLPWISRSPGSSAMRC